MSYSRTVKIAALLGASAMLPTAAFANCGTTCNSGHSAHNSYSAPALSSWSASPSYVAPATSSYSSGSSYDGGSINSQLSTLSGSSYGGATSYMSSGTSMGASYGSGMSAANCPSGTTPQSDGTCLDTSGSFSSSSSYVSSSPSYSSTTTYSAPASTSYVSSSYSAPVTSSYSSTNYGSGSISATYSDSSATVVPFTGSTSVLGLGANESLVPTDCPVSVYNPGGGKVLGCYAVSKPAPVMQPVTTYTRIVRPVIYVRYPVPTPVPYIQDVYVGGCGGYNTRYGAAYPGGCGW